MIKKSFQYIVGDADQFSLQSRIFHGISIVISLTLLAKSIFYSYTSLQLAAIVCALALIAELGFYYLSRFKGHVTLAITLCVAKLILMQIGIFQYNAGVDGNILLLSSISIFLIILITPIRQGVLWIMGNVSLVLVMLVMEYRNPSFVKQYYASELEKFIDLGITYTNVAAILCAGIIILRNSYEQQRMLVIRQSQKLKLMNDEKDKLFSIISHDLNAPLSSVKQYLELLRATELDAAERQDIEKDLACSLRDAKILLNNLLLWAKNQMQLNYVQLEAVDFGKLLIQTVNLFKQRAEEKKIKINIAIAADIYVKADQNMLKVVLRNLLNNALKFSHLGGEIEIKAFIENERCIVVLKDYGIGITEEKQEKIFSLNISSSYGTANEKGSGLGLILCRDFMAQQGGEIWFDSTPWEGTTFYLSLPVEGDVVSIIPGPVPGSNSVNQ
ncbi:sensor histidine kinase [Pedobacter immunditicola]|uniref:sensor histidine kinase n=1 Tax=Pedobacter immunditicola TaxID=3133440 RepID=UPI0030B49A2B